MTIDKADAATLAADLESAHELRAKFKTDKEAGVKAAAQEFEALFLQMMLKSMRATTDQDGFMDNEASRFFTGMLDEQIAKDLSRTGSIGLAQILEAQLRRRIHGADAPDSLDGASMRQAATLAASGGEKLPLAAFDNPDWRAALERVSQASAASVSVRDAPAAATPRDFVSQLWPHAVEASRDTGIPPQFLIAHAALESGWGQRDIRNADGSPTHNLFGIKAGESWQGKSVEITTTEYENGTPVTQKARFRAYDSHAEAFADYARLLSGNPRYSGVIGSQNGTEFARRLQQAGYASDPKYAEKLSAIINGPTLRQALIG
jgi:flagellar protein FlgJ